MLAAGARRRRTRALSGATSRARPRRSERVEPPRGAADRPGPAADNTDLYAFVSPTSPNTLTIIANYIPLEEPAGGPNFFRFADSARYEINDRQRTATAGGHHLPVPLQDARRGTRHFLYNTGRSPRSADRTGTGRRPTRVTRVRTASGRRRPRSLGRTSDAARQHRAALDAELRGRWRRRPSRTCPAASRSSPASVTTRSSSTSARSSTWPASSVQPVPPDPRDSGGGMDVSRLQHHTRSRSSPDRAARCRHAEPRRSASARAPSRQNVTGPEDGTSVHRGAGCRSRASATR